MKCHEVQNEMMDLLSSSARNENAAATQANVDAHVAMCNGCAAELAALKTTMAQMDAWTAPAVSPWFDAKMAAKLRAEMERQPEGFFERMRSRVLFGSSVGSRQMLAGAMALVLLVGGGSFAGVEYLHGAARAGTGAEAQSSSTVEDLQQLDKNTQALQEIDQLVDGGGSDDGSASHT